MIKYLSTCTLMTLYLRYVRLLKGIWAFTSNALDPHFFTSFDPSCHSPCSKDFSNVSSSSLFSDDVVLPGDKSTVVRTISASIINPVDGKSQLPLRKRPFQKRCSRVHPLIAHCGSPFTIKSVAPCVGIVTSLNHGVPNSPQTVLAHSMSSCSKAPTAFGFSGDQAAPKNSTGFPALTFTCPKWFRIFIRPISLDGNQFSKTRSGELCRLPTHYLTPCTIKRNSVHQGAL